MNEVMTKVAKAIESLKSMYPPYVAIENVEIVNNSIILLEEALDKLCEESK